MQNTGVAYYKGDKLIIEGDLWGSFEISSVDLIAWDIWEKDGEYEVENLAENLARFCADMIKNAGKVKNVYGDLQKLDIALIHDKTSVNFKYEDQGLVANLERLNVFFRPYNLHRNIYVAFGEDRTSLECNGMVFYENVGGYADLFRRLAYQDRVDFEAVAVFKRAGKGTDLYINGRKVALLDWNGYKFNDDWFISVSFDKNKSDAEQLLQLAWDLYEENVETLKVKARRRWDMYSVRIGAFEYVFTDEYKNYTLGWIEYASVLMILKKSVWVKLRNYINGSIPHNGWIFEKIDSDERRFQLFSK